MIEGKKKEPCAGTQDRQIASDGTICYCSYFILYLSFYQENTKRGLNKDGYRKFK
ncbi:MAG: hypothetical protein ACLR1F_00680 [Enterococcus avium]|uniref:hypothetical protein n=1 Tax=Enterococcus avium TaxID=33945 RepID=UPI0026FDAF90|nr:hypothetical protein [Enterococcus avium]MDO7799411.1 hypothetical protein [Enterococcus avium]